MLSIRKSRRIKDLASISDKLLRVFLNANERNMGGPVKKILDRAPRYVLDAADGKIVRVAPRNRRKNQIYHLEIVDVSETGMSFIVNWNYLPQIGEILKVEFPVPGEENPPRKVAWFAKVIRLEGQGERPDSMRHFSGIKIAVEFIDMPPGHIKTLKTGLNQKTKKRISWQQAIESLRGHEDFFKVLGQIVFLAGVVGAMYLFFKTYTETNLNYNPHRPVKWGERFFDRVIKKDR